MRIFKYGVFLLILGCSKSSPPGILPESKMVEIITEIQLVDAAFKLNMLPDDYKENSEKYYLDVLAQYETDTATFRKSMSFYASDPKRLKEIYQKVEINIKGLATPSN